jgi:hypothetical protein
MERAQSIHGEFGLGNPCDSGALGGLKKTRKQRPKNSKTALRNRPSSI